MWGCEVNHADRAIIMSYYDTHVYNGFWYSKHTATISIYEQTLSLVSVLLDVKCHAMSAHSQLPGHDLWPDITGMTQVCGMCHYTGTIHLKDKCTSLFLTMDKTHIYIYIYVLTKANMSSLNILQRRSSNVANKIRMFYFSKHVN